MNRLINEEINRTLELMGITKSIISEGTIIKGLFKELTDFLRPKEVKIAGSSRKVQHYLGEFPVNKTFYDDFKKLISDFDNNWGFWVNDVNKLKTLASFIRSSDDLLKKFYKNLIEDLISNTVIISETNLYSKLRKAAEIAKNNGLDFDFEKEVENIITDPFEKEVLVPFLKNNYDDYLNGKFIQTVFPVDVSIVSTKLTQRQIKNFNKVITTSTRYWNNVGIAITKSLDELSTEIKSLSQGYIDDISKLKLSANQTQESIEQAKILTNAYSVQIANYLAMMQSKMQNSAIRLLEQEALPQDILNTLRNDPNTFFKLFRDSIKRAPNLAKGEKAVSFAEFISDSIKTNFEELGSFFRTLFSKNFYKSMIHLMNPRRDLGIWFYTNQWAGFNKLYDLMIKTSALQNWRRFSEFYAKSMVITNIGYFSGWMLKAGVFSAWEIFGKPLLNVILKGISEIKCFIMGLLEKPCNELKIEQEYIGEGWASTFEAALIREFWNEGFIVVNEQYKKNPRLSAIFRLVPVINYFETYRNSVAAKSVEKITGRQLLLNYTGEDPEKMIDDGKEELRIQGTDSTILDSININLDEPLIPPSQPDSSNIPNDTEIPSEDNKEVTKEPQYENSTDGFYKFLTTVYVDDYGRTLMRERDKSRIKESGAGVYTFEEASGKIVEYKYENGTFNKIIKKNEISLTVKKVLREIHKKKRLINEQSGTWYDCISDLIENITEEIKLKDYRGSESVKILTLGRYDFYFFKRGSFLSYPTGFRDENERQGGKWDCDTDDVKLTYYNNVSISLKKIILNSVKTPFSCINSYNFKNNYDLLKKIENSNDKYEVVKSSEKREMVNVYSLDGTVIYRYNDGKKEEKVRGKWICTGDSSYKIEWSDSKHKTEIYEQASNETNSNEEVIQELLDYGNQYIDSNDCDKIYDDLLNIQKSAERGELVLSTEDKTSLDENIKKLKKQVIDAVFGKEIKCGVAKSMMKNEFENQSTTNVEKLKTYLCWFAKNIDKKQLKACQEIIKSEPAPEPKPEPAPEPKPEPAPEPKPEPAPQPKPEPAPQPKPEPAPQPKPVNKKKSPLRIISKPEQID